MNILFFIVFSASIISLIFKNPSAILPALTSGAKNAITLSLTLAAIYLIWLGIYGVAENSGVTDKLAKLLRKPVKKLFGETGKAEKDICLNLAANLLGLGGIATPKGIDAMKTLSKDKNDFACCLLTVLASTSMQIIPTSVVSLRLERGSTNPSAIILPTIICSVVSFIVSVTLTKIFIKK